MQAQSTLDLSSKGIGIRSFPIGSCKSVQATNTAAPHQAQKEGRTGDSCTVRKCSLLLRGPGWPHAEASIAHLEPPTHIEPHLGDSQVPSLTLSATCFSLWFSGFPAIKDFFFSVFSNFLFWKILKLSKGQTKEYHAEHNIHLSCFANY